MDTSANLFLTISLVMVLAAGVAGVMRLLRQPLIVGYIITGILIGPSFLRIIPTGATFETFSTLGIALLLFIIGLGLNAGVVKRLGKVTLVTAAAQIGLTALAGYGLAAAVGLEPTEAVIIGMALAFSSTIIIIKLLNDKREQTRLYAQISIGILLLQDLVASIVLILLPTMSKDGLSPAVLLLLALKGVGVGMVLVLLSTQLLPRLARFVASSQEFLFLFALAWGLGIATVFQLLGFSIEVGALCAGVSLASLPFAQEAGARLKPLRDFFVVVFFIALGEGFGISQLDGILVPALLFTLVVVIIKPLTALATMGLMGYTRRTSFKTALTLGQISEFSLIFVALAQKQDLISSQVVSTITLIALFTIALSTYLIKYDEQLFLLLEHLLRFFERSNVNAEQHHLHGYPLVLFGYRKGGDEFIKSFKALQKKFVVVDYDPEVIEHLEHRRINHLYGDATNLELLEELGLHRTKLVVSTITDHTVNVSLVRHVLKANPHAIVICHSDSYEEAAELYHLGAMYVMLPHLIGSERIGSFIRRSGLHKKEFVHYREKHLMLLEQQNNN